jgi:hypothetical protein
MSGVLTVVKQAHHDTARDDDDAGGGDDRCRGAANRHRLTQKTRHRRVDQDEARDTSDHKHAPGWAP